MKHKHADMITITEVNRQAGALYASCQCGWQRGPVFTLSTIQSFAIAHLVTDHKD